jgi:hypothetical protein
VNESAQQERRIGILTVLFVLLVVAAFWTLYPQKWPFRSEGSEAEPGLDAGTARAKSMLESFQQLPGDDPGKIGPLRFGQRSISMVMGSYATKSDCGTLELHYKEEFAKHGFTYTGTNDSFGNESSGNESSRTKRRSLSFSSQVYIARLSCTDTEGLFRPYFIIMWSKPRA